jgi:hypothetical protein
MVVNVLIHKDGDDINSKIKRKYIQSVDYGGRRNKFKIGKENFIISFSGKYLLCEILKEDSLKVLVCFANKNGEIVDSIIQKRNIAKLWSVNSSDNINSIDYFGVRSKYKVGKENFIISLSERYLPCDILIEDSINLVVCFANKKGEIIDSVVPKKNINRIWDKKSPKNILCKNIITKDSAVLIPGFYKSFFEFKYNCPFIEGTFPAISDSITGSSIFVRRFSITCVKFNVDLNFAKSIGEVYGYCDGVNVFLYGGELTKLTSSIMFTKLDNIGRYCVFDEMVVNGNNNLNSVSLGYNVLDLNTGSIRKDINRYVLNELIKKDSVLVENFEKEEDKRKNIKKYLVQYSNRHKDEIIK